MTYLTKIWHFLVIWTECRQFVQKKCLWKEGGVEPSQVLQLPIAVTTPPVKKRFLKSPQTFQKPKI